jgi:hypothetical protein
MNTEFNGGSKGRVARISPAEVAVAAGIVAVLGAILFPMIAQAKAPIPPGAPTAASGIRQIAQAVLEYVSDSDDAFPIGCGSSFYKPIGGGWVFGVQQYVASGRAWTSPSDPQSRAAWPDWVRQVPGVYNISYAANGFMKFSAAKGSWGMYGVMGVNQADGVGANTPGWMSRGLTSVSDIHRPDDTVMLAERFGSYPTFAASDIFTGVNWWDGTSGVGCLIPNGSAPKNQPYVVNGVVVNGDIQNGGMNAKKGVRAKQSVAFADGHVQPMRPMDTNPDPANHPDQNKWDIEH